MTVSGMSKYVPWVFLVVWLLKLLENFILEQYKYLQCLLAVVQTNIAMEVSLVSGSFVMEDMISWVSSFWTATSTVMLSSVTVSLSYVNNLWSVMTTLINFSSPMVQLAIVLISFLAAYCPHLIVLTFRLMVFPFVFLIKLWYNTVMTPVRWVVYCVNTIFEQAHNCWISVTTFPTYVREYLDGKLAVETTLPTGKIVRVSIIDKIDEILSILKGLTRNYEAIQSGNPFYSEGKWPAGLVIVRDSFGTTKGMGFLTVVGGKWYLGTAAHVAQRCTSGIILTAGLGENVKHVVVGDAAIKLTGSMDFVLVAVPSNTASVLGVKTAKMAKGPASGLPITAYGFVKGEFVSSTGTVVSPTQFFGFKHSVSTINGFSGTPLYRDGLIVGVHSRSNGISENFGLNLDFISGSLESKDYDSRRFMREQTEFEDVNASEVAWEFEDKAFLGKSTPHSWAVKESDRLTFTGANLSDFVWADDAPMDFEDLPVFESGFRRGPFTGATPTMTGKKTVQPSTTVSLLESSISTTPAEKVTPASPRKKKSKRKSRSKTGNGLKVESVPSGVVSCSTSSVSQSGVGVPPPVKSEQSNGLSWTQIYTRELLSLIGSGIGQVEAVKRAKQTATQAVNFNAKTSPQ